MQLLHRIEVIIQPAICWSDGRAYTQIFYWNITDIDVGYTETAFKEVGAERSSGLRCVVGGIIGLWSFKGALHIGNNRT